MIPIEIPPGVAQRRSKSSKSNNWYEANLVRWDDLTLYPVGGWDRRTYDIPFASRVRKVHKWVDNSGKLLTAYLCESNVYVDINGTLTDISPTPAITAPYSTGYDEGGYGDDAYGSSTYGTPRSTRPRTRPYTPSYSIGNWGQELRVMTSADGRYLGWDPSTPATPCAAVSGAPTGRCFVVTPEQHVIIFGVDGDANTYGWCSNSDDTDWDFADPTNTAGSRPIQPYSPIITALHTGHSVFAFTANGNAYSIEYIGTPYIYNHEEQGLCSIPYSSDSVTRTPEGAIWFSQSGFWQWDGVNIQPVVCEVWDWITENIDEYFTRYEASVVNLGAMGEAWFFFVEPGQQYNSRYAMFDYRQRVWSMGILDRSCGFSFPNDTNPLMSDGTYIYNHESGVVYGNYTLNPYIETFGMNAEGGANRITLKKILPDVSGDYSVLNWSVAKTEKRAGSDETYSEPRHIRDNGYVDIRETARDLRIRIEAIGVPSAIWSVGTLSVDMVVRGKK